MSTVGFLEARENYDGVTAAQISANTQPAYCTTDQVYPGMTYDPVQRLFYYPLTRATGTTPANPTGFPLFSGYSFIGIGNTYNDVTNFNFTTLIKNIDSDQVLAYDGYDPAATVPVGIGAGMVTTYSVAGGAGYVLSVTGNPSDVPLQGGHGQQFMATLSIAGGVISILAGNVNSFGRGYQAGDVLTAPAGLFSAGAGFSVTVNTVYVGSDGTVRRYIKDALAGSQSSQGNGPGIVNSYTGDYWIVLQSCELHQLRKTDNFAMTISPLLSQHNAGNQIPPVGITAAWVYAKEQWTSQAGATQTDLYLVPRVRTAEEVLLDYKLIYATFTYPAAVNTAWYKECFDHAGNFYVFECQQTGAKAFKLYRFTPPTSAPYGGPTVGGGFSEITPWGAANGPNTDAAGYTLRAAAHSWQTPNEHVMAYYLPNADVLALLSEFYPTEHTANSIDPTLFFIDCTYVAAPAGGAPAFDHHSKFVTGYMTAAWQPTSDPMAAAWAISDFLSLDHYLTTHDFDYRPVGASYTDRWFNFRCQTVTGGSVDTSHNNTQDVFVLYRFAYGAAPQLVLFYTEAPWNDNPLYALYDGFNVVAGSMNPPPNTAGLNLYLGFQDRGFWDNQSGAWWWSGQEANVPSLAPQFADRSGKDRIALPFLRVSARFTPDTSSAGRVYTRYASLP